MRCSPRCRTICARRSPPSPARRQPARSRRQHDRGATRRTARLHRGGTARLSRFVQPARHVAHRAGGLKARRDWSMWRTSSGAPSRAAAGLSARRHPASAWPPTCRSCAATPASWNRSCSTCSTTRRNTVATADRRARAARGRRSDAERHGRRSGRESSRPDRIFEKFYRGGRNDGRKAGTGLGLSICKVWWKPWAAA